MTITDAIGMGIDSLHKLHYNFETDMDRENGFKHNYEKAETCPCQCGEAIRALKSLTKILKAMQGFGDKYKL